MHKINLQFTATALHVDENIDEYRSAPESHRFFGILTKLLEAEFEPTEVIVYAGAVKRGSAEFLGNATFLYSALDAFIQAAALFEGGKRFEDIIRSAIRQSYSPDTRIGMIELDNIQIIPDIKLYAKQRPRLQNWRKLPLAWLQPILLTLLVLVLFFRPQLTGPGSSDFPAVNITVDVPRDSGSVSYENLVSCPAPSAFPENAEQQAPHERVRVLP